MILILQNNCFKTIFNFSISLRLIFIIKKSDLKKILLEKY